MIFNNKQSCAADISNSVRGSATWRRGLQAKYPNARNFRAAATLDRIADEVYDMTDEQFKQLSRYYNWSSLTWSEAVSETSRLVGYRGVDTLSDYINALAHTLSKSGVAA